MDKLRQINMSQKEQGEILRHIQIVHILDDEQKITDPKKFEKEYRDFFTINEQEIRREVFRLRKLTSFGNKSILYIKQNGDFFSIVNVTEDTQI